MKKILIFLLLLLWYSITFWISIAQEIPENQFSNKYLLNNYLEFFWKRNEEAELIRNINASKNLHEKIRILETLYPDTPNLKKILKKIDLTSLKLLSRKYWKDKRGIYFWGYENPLTAQTGTFLDKQLIKIKKADPATFRILNNKKDISTEEEVYQTWHLSFENTSMYIEYAVDKNFVYDNEKVLKGADPKSFKIFKFGHLAKDDDQVFFRSRYDDNLPNIELPWVNAKTFEVLSWAYAKDMHYVYAISNCGGGSGRETCIERLKDADSHTFHLLEWENDKIFAKDKKYFYNEYGYTVNRFWENIEEKEQNPKKEYREPAEKDIQEKIQTPDHQRLILQQNKRYLINKNGKIWQKHLDPKTFWQFRGNQNYDFIPDDWLFSDKNGIYRYNKRLKGLSKKNFIYYGKSHDWEQSSYVWNGKIIYYQGKRISKADIKTFEVIDGISWTDGRDKNYYYKNGEIIFKR